MFDDAKKDSCTICLFCRCASSDMKTTYDIAGFKPTFANRFSQPMRKWTLLGIICFVMKPAAYGQLCKSIGKLTIKQSIMACFMKPPTTVVGAQSEENRVKLIPCAIYQRDNEL